MTLKVTTKTLNEAVRLINGAGSIAIVTHVSPDGDAIGSALGLMWALRAFGADACVYDDDAVPERLTILPGHEEFRQRFEGDSPDLLIAVDCGDEMRIGDVGRAIAKRVSAVINIDHHVTNTLFGTLNLVDPETVASVETALDLIDALGIPLDARMAQCLLLGLATDTLGFRTPNVHAGVLEKAARLMKAGGDLSLITGNVLNRYKFGTIQLWGGVLSDARLEDGVCWLCVTDAQKQAAGFDDERTGLMGVLSSVIESPVSAVFEQYSGQQRTNVSLRAVPGFDVSKVAVALGGGGHPAASGATVDGLPGEVAERVVPMLKDVVREGRG